MAGNCGVAGYRCNHPINRGNILRTLASRSISMSNNNNCPHQFYFLIQQFHRTPHPNSPNKTTGNSSLTHTHRFP